MKFVDFQACLRRDLLDIEQRLAEPSPIENPEQLPALILAYVGDAVFSLHFRTAMLAVEGNKVQVLHTLMARMASAPFQAQALHCIEASLTELELAVVRRGRNAKSRVPRNASIAEYRSSTALEALFGYLFLQAEYERLDELFAQVFSAIAEKMVSDEQEKNKK